MMSGGSNLTCSSCIDLSARERERGRRREGGREGAREEEREGKMGIRDLHVYVHTFISYTCN